MGNIYAESGLSSTNLQNSFEKKLGYTDASYTSGVDAGTYTNFVRDSAGYGLCQWTYWSRKQALLEFCHSKGTSIGDLEKQLEVMYKELSENYGTVMSVLRSATTVLQASNSVLLQYERPADQSSAVQSKRASYGQVYYDKFASKTNQQEGGKTMGYTNSSLVDCAVKSPNHSGKNTLYRQDYAALCCWTALCRIYRWMLYKFFKTGKLQLWYWERRSCRTLRR